MTRGLFFGHRIHPKITIKGIIKAYPSSASIISGVVVPFSGFFFDVVSHFFWSQFDVCHDSPTILGRFSGLEDVVVVIKPEFHPFTRLLHFVKLEELHPRPMLIIGLKVKPEFNGLFFLEHPIKLILPNRTEFGNPIDSPMIVFLGRNDLNVLRPGH